MIGILLAFQITEWAGRRSDRAREAQIIRDVLADLDIDRSQYLAAMAADKSRIRAANVSLVGAGLPPIEFDGETSNSEKVDYTFEMWDLAGLPASRVDTLWSGVIVGYHPTPSPSLQARESDGQLTGGLPLALRIDLGKHNGSILV